MLAKIVSDVWRGSVFPIHSEDSAASHSLHQICPVLPFSSRGPQRARDNRRHSGVSSRNKAIIWSKRALEGAP